MQCPTMAHARPWPMHAYGAPYGQRQLTDGANNFHLGVLPFPRGEDGAPFNVQNMIFKEKLNTRELVFDSSNNIAYSCRKNT